MVFQMRIIERLIQLGKWNSNMIRSYQRALLTEKKPEIRYTTVFTRMNIHIYSVDKKVNNIHVFYDIYGFKTVKI